MSTTWYAYDYGRATQTLGLNLTGTLTSHLLCAFDQLPLTTLHHSNQAATFSLCIHCPFCFYRPLPLFPLRLTPS